MLYLGSYVQSTVELKRTYLLASVTISELSKKNVFVLIFCSNFWDPIWRNCCKSCVH